MYIILKAVMKKNKNKTRNRATKNKGLAKLRSISRSRKIGLIVFAILFAGIGGYFLFKSFALTVQGTYTNWFWNPPSEGFNTVEHGLTVEAVTPDAPFFWSHQFKLINGDGGYIGLQSNGSRVDGTRGKTVVFSIFNAGIEGSPANHCKVEQKGFDGYAGSSGTSCRIAYDWQTNHKYNLRVAIYSRESTGNWWIASVEDTTTGEKTWIAKIKVPATWKGLGSWSSMWTEFFGVKPATCELLPYSRVRFYAPVANNGTVQPTSKSNYMPSGTDCPTSSITNFTGGSVQQFGNPNYVSPDTTRPVVTITQPAQGTTISAGSSLTIAATATDNKSVSNMSVLIDGNTIKTMSGSGIIASWQAPSNSGKKKRTQSHTVTIQARDAAGNVGSSSVQVYVK